MASGKFITLEGGEGVGKSLQAERLSSRLKDQGIDVVLTREPGGSPFAEHLRALLLNPGTPSHSPLSEALLFYAARSDHLETKIRPALAAGTWVICDRFSDSTRAYQGAAGKLSGDAIDALEKLVVAPTFPDLTIVIDLDPTIGMQRADLRRTSLRPDAEQDASPGRDRFEGRDTAFHQALRAGFLEIAKDNADRCTVVDGGHSPDVIAGEIWQCVVDQLLGQER